MRPAGRVGGRPDDEPHRRESEPSPAARARNAPTSECAEANRTVAPVSAAAAAGSAVPGTTTRTPSLAAAAARPRCDASGEDEVVAADAGELERRGERAVDLVDVRRRQRQREPVAGEDLADVSVGRRLEVRAGAGQVEARRRRQERQVGGDVLGREPLRVEAAAVERALRRRVRDERPEAPVGRSRTGRQLADAVDVVPGRQPADHPVLEGEDVDRLELDRDALVRLAAERDLDRDRVPANVDLVRVVVVHGVRDEHRRVVRAARRRGRWRVRAPTPTSSASSSRWPRKSSQSSPLRPSK